MDSLTTTRLSAIVARSGALALALVVGGCTSSGASPPTTADGSPAPSTVASAGPTAGPSGTLRASRLPLSSGSPVGSLDAGAVPQALLEVAMTDATAVMSTARDRISVVRAERATWNDGARGCPKAGVVYTQAIVDGYWIVLDAAGTKIDYRFSEAGDFRRCDRSGLVGPGG